MTKFSLRIVLLGALAFLSPAASAEMARKPFSALSQVRA